MHSPHCWKLYPVTNWQLVITIIKVWMSEICVLENYSCDDRVQINLLKQTNIFSKNFWLTQKCKSRNLGLRQSNCSSDRLRPQESAWSDKLPFFFAKKFPLFPHFRFPNTFTACAYDIGYSSVWNAQRVWSFVHLSAVFHFIAGEKVEKEYRRCSDTRFLFKILSRYCCYFYMFIFKKQCQLDTMRIYLWWRSERRVSNDVCIPWQQLQVTRADFVQLVIELSEQDIDCTRGKHQARYKTSNFQSNCLLGQLTKNSRRIYLVSDLNWSKISKNKISWNGADQHERNVRCGTSYTRTRVAHTQLLRKTTLQLTGLVSTCKPDVH